MQLQQPHWLRLGHQVRHLREPVCVARVFPRRLQKQPLVGWLFFFPERRQLHHLQIFQPKTFRLQHPKKLTTLHN